MATDQTSPLIADRAEPKSSAIENELPTYRAISRLAVFSVICGVLASFSFAGLIFLVFAVAAIALGISANIAIRRYPDMLTGRGLANAGIALGLVFGLVVTTYTGISSYLLARDATQFARVYARTLKEGSLGDVLLYGAHPAARKSKTPEQMVEELDKMKTKDRMLAETKTAPMNNLRKKLALPGTQIEFVDIESQGEDASRPGEINYYALVVFKVKSAESKGEHDGDQYALAYFRGIPKGRHYDWWVDDLKYPYQPKSYQIAGKPVDDGHGHAH